jgi:hypothetical protein
VEFGIPPIVAAGTDGGKCPSTGVEDARGDGYLVSGRMTLVRSTDSFSVS